MKRFFAQLSIEKKMKNTTRVFPFLFVLLLLLTACGQRRSAVPETPVVQQPEEPYSRYLPDTSAEMEQEPSAEEPTEAELAARAAAEEAARVREILDGMTTEEKVGQLFFVRCPAADVEAKIAEYHLGGVLLFTRDYQDANGDWLTKEDFVAKLQGYQAAAADDTGISLFIGSDEEGGAVTRASRNPYLFPAKSQSPQALYASGGIGAILNDAMEKNFLLRELGVNVNFAPVADVSTDPNDFIYDRTLGQDAAATADYVSRVVSAMGDAGVDSVLKHFPGYGNNADTHTGVAVDERPYETFETVDFLPFAAGIDAGAPFVLASHNVVTCMDPELPASLSPAVHEILRGELGFEGVILTDDLAMDAVRAYTNDGSVAVLALLAGNDMIVTTDFETQIPQVLAAVEDGTISGELLDAAAARVLKAKLELGLLEG